MTNKEQIELLELAISYIKEHCMRLGTAWYYALRFKKYAQYSGAYNISVYDLFALDKDRFEAKKKHERIKILENKLAEIKNLEQ